MEGLEGCCTARFGDGWADVVMLDAGCWMLDAGCWMLDAGCWMLDAGCWMLDAGCAWVENRTDRSYRAYGADAGARMGRAAFEELVVGVG